MPQPHPRCIYCHDLYPRERGYCMCATAALAARVRALEKVAGRTWFALCGFVLGVVFVAIAVALADLT